MSNTSGATTGAPLDPMTVTVAEACRLSGHSRSELYRLLGRGELRAVKAGVRTLVLVDSLRVHVARLPPATFRAPKCAV